MSTERLLKSLLVVLSCLSLGVGCTRSSSSGHSRLIIQTPSKEKVGALSLPSGRTVCWGVNVTGAGIDGSNATTCSPATGVTAGFQASGDSISLSVPKGTARKIDLLVYLLPAASSSACPALGKVIPPSLLKDTYLMGSATADLIKDDEEVQITAVFPGEANNLVASLGLPATCTTPVLPISSGTTFGFNTGSGVVEGVAGDGSKVIGRASGVTGQKVLTHASGMKLIVE